MEEEKILSKRDIILFFVILFVGLAAILVIKLNEKDGYTVEVSINGEKVKSFNILKDAEYDIVTDEGHNLLVIEDGEAYIEDADCKDKICKKHAPIKKEGETIICLPHKVVIEVKE